VLHTSEKAIGQIYVPAVNDGLLVAVVLLILIFRSSDALGAAYGIAVSGTMMITTVLAYLYFRGLGWSRLRAASVFGLFLVVDLTFFNATLLKITEGGWFPVAVAAAVATVMSTWWRGRQAVAAASAREAMPLDAFVRRFGSERVERIPGTAIFVTRNNEAVPHALLHVLKHFKSLHQRAVVMTVRTVDIPHVREDKRLVIRDMGNGFYSVTVRFGFIDQPNVPRALKDCPAEVPLRIDWMNTSVIVGREKIIAAEPERMLTRWLKQLFIFMNKLSLDATEFFCIPPNRVVEVGGQIEI